jgi:hypothetical protein
MFLLDQSQERWDAATLNRSHIRRQPRGSDQIPQIEPTGGGDVGKEPSFSDKFYAFAAFFFSSAA